ncbi:YL1 nuclear protein-domain-containing protein [Mycena belliarum]|uniref:YL1 nuclear protein-domain-containing protein n=1 Tax=Mycena belliarum TaxID=1033014 RepID=A0AAD6UQJ1_9AGAR|nr:YL1 nuclear protein-domain-containing protein [Mycena belliae]
MPESDTDTVADAELLVRRRSRRSTAGNRMEAAMAEMELDESMKDGEDDADFTNPLDEEDIFDADFESTDEEAQDEEATGEIVAGDEDRRARKATRSRLEKATDAAHARNKATFGPQDLTSTPKVKRRVALGGAVNAVTGETIAERRPAHRQSMRKHTVLNTSLTETRLKHSKEKKAAQAPKKPRPEGRAASQAELIARALDAEEGNIVEHRDYLKLEEEKRRRARVVRPAVEGPLLRWVSRVEEDKVTIQPPPAYPYAYAPGSSGGGYLFPTYLLPAAGSSTVSPSNNVANSTFASPTSTSSSSMVQNPSISTHSLYRPTGAPYLPYAPPAAPIVRREKAAHNYVVHEEMQGGEPDTPAGRSTTRHQSAHISKPSWAATMTAMFGGHVDWEEVKVYAGKNRPLARPVQICPITGRAAPYRDPRTGVPFADVGAFETLTRLLKHDYVWAPEFGAYIRQEVPEAKPVRMED